MGKLGQYKVVFDKKLTKIIFNSVNKIILIICLVVRVVEKFQIKVNNYNTTRKQITNNIEGQNYEISRYFEEI